MEAQLRQYKVKPGQMAAFLNAWENGVLPIRELYGFRVLAAWRSEDDSEFGWLVAHEGPGDFEAADKAYYASPERKGLADDPAAYLDAVTTRMVDTV